MIRTLELQHQLDRFQIRKPLLIYIEICIKRIIVFGRGIRIIIFLQFISTYKDINVCSFIMGISKWDLNYNVSQNEIRLCLPTKKCN